MRFDALQRATTVVLALAALTVLAIVVLAPGATVASGTQTAPAGLSESTGPTPPAARSVAPVEPTVTVGSEVARAEPLNATVALPSRANDTASFRVALEGSVGSASITRNVTLDPGDSVTVSFGTCLDPDSYVVRVYDTDGTAVAASQTTVRAPDDPVVLDRSEGYELESLVDRDDDVSLRAELQGCTDRTRIALYDEPDGATQNPETVWAVTVVDRDDDGVVDLRWDVDDTASSALSTSDGDSLLDVQHPTNPTDYGRYRLVASVDGTDVVDGTIQVAFAAPSVTVFSANRSMTATEAIDAASEDEGSGQSLRDPMFPREWVVVRVDTDGTLDALPADERLVAPARYGNATLRVQGVVGPEEDPSSGLDLANATRRFDVTTGTVWYAFRANRTMDVLRLQYAAFGSTQNVTADAEFRVEPPARLSIPDEFVLPADSNVTVDGHSALPAGTTLTVVVRTDDGVVARDDVVVGEDSEFTAGFDLAGIANGTNATVFVRRDERIVASRPVTIDARSVLELRGFRAAADASTDEAVVRVYLENRGHSPGETQVVVTVGNVTRERTVTVNATTGRRVTVELPVADVDVGDAYEVVVRAANATETQTFEVQGSDAPSTDHTITTVGDPPTAQVGTTTAWPTLAGSRSAPGDGPTPGFGVLLAALALAATGALAVRRRTRP